MFGGVVRQQLSAVLTETHRGPGDVVPTLIPEHGSSFSGRKHGHGSTSLPRS